MEDKASYLDVPAVNPSHALTPLAQPVSTQSRSIRAAEARISRILQRH